MKYATLFVALVGTLVIPMQSNAQTVTVLTEEYPPLNYMDTKTGEITGSSTDVVRKIFEKAGVTYAIKLLPWQRGYSTVLETNNTCLYSTAMTDSRRDLFKWVGPFPNEVSVFLAALYDSPIQPSPLEAIKHYRIGSAAGDAKTDFLTKKGLTIDISATDDVNLPKLEAKRIDLWAVSEFKEKMKLTEKEGYFIRNGVKLKKITPLDEMQTGYGLACNVNLDAKIHNDLVKAFSALDLK